MINELYDELISVPSVLSMDYGIATAATCGTVCESSMGGCGSTACQGTNQTCSGACQGYCEFYGQCGQSGGCTSQSGGCTSQTNPCAACMPNTMCSSTCIPVYQCGTCQVTGQACTATCEVNCQTTCQSATQAHSTLISGTVHEITSGKTLISGTAHDLSEGKVLVGSTVYNLPLTYDLIVYDGGANVLTGTFTSKYIAGSTGANNVSGTSTISNGLIICGGAMTIGGNPTCGQVGSGGQYGWCYIGPIDFTEFNNLHVIGYKEGAQGYFGYSSTSTVPSSPSSDQITQLKTSSATYTIDISTITGNRYFVMAGFNQQTATPGYAYVSKIWLTP